MSARDVIALQTLRAIAGGSDLVLDDFDTQSIAQAYEDADAILSALAAAGYAVVPVEPTKGMQQAAFDTAVATLAKCGGSGREGADKMNAAIWTAMIAAAAKEGEGIT